MAKTRVNRKSSTRQRTAPYLGVACLALLAFASVHAFAPEVGSAASAGRMSGGAALSWLAAPAAPPALLETAARLAAHATGLAATQAVFALASAALLLASLALLTQRLRRSTARPQGSLSAPALLIAVALARAH